MLLSAVLAAALRITAAGDAFMVQGFPKDYAVDASLKSWIASGDAHVGCVRYGHHASRRRHH